MQLVKVCDSFISTGKVASWFPTPFMTFGISFHLTRYQSHPQLSFESMIWSILYSSCSYTISGNSCGGLNCEGYREGYRE